VEVRLLNQRSRGWRWVRINGLLEFDENKKPSRLVGVWVDITRRKMADLHAMEDRDLFRTLINYLPDNIYFKNRESRFVIANEATAKKMKVRTPSDLIGSRDSNFFDPEMCEIARAEEAGIMATGKPILNRIHHEKWKGGKSTWGKVSKFPWYAADGTVKGIVGISSDVTKLIEIRMTHTSSGFDYRNGSMLTHKVNQSTSSARYQQINPSTGIQQFGCGFMPCRE
jgi:sigma-B regulation protein RsbU (phosphoserine phosphatase)